MEDFLGAPAKFMRFSNLENAGAPPARSEHHEGPTMTRKGSPAREQESDDTRVGRRVHVRSERGLLLRQRGRRRLRPRERRPDCRPPQRLLHVPGAPCPPRPSRPGLYLSRSITGTDSDPLRAWRQYILELNLSHNKLDSLPAAFERRVRRAAGMPGRMNLMGS